VHSPLHVCHSSGKRKRLNQGSFPKIFRSTRINREIALTFTSATALISTTEYSIESLNKKQQELMSPPREISRACDIDCNRQDQ